MKKNLLQWAVCAAMLLMPLGANAQLGGLKKLKDKAQTAVKQQAGAQAQQQANQAVATAQMSEEQRWATEQLRTFSEAPALPNIMKVTEDAYSGGSVVATKMIQDFAEAMGRAEHSKVVEMRSMIDARLAYNLRVTEAFRRDNTSYDWPSDQGLSKRFNMLLDEVILFQILQEQIRFNLQRPTSEIRKRDGKMVLPSNSDIWPPTNAKSHRVTKDPSDGKCKFFDGSGPCKIDAEEVERVKSITINYLDNAITLLEINPDLDKREKLCSNSYNPQEYILDYIEKCKVAKACVQEALDNNK